MLGTVVILCGVYVGAFLTRRPTRSTAPSLPECLPTEDCFDQAAPQREPAAS